MLRCMKNLWWVENLKMYEFSRFFSDSNQFSRFLLQQNERFIKIDENVTKEKQNQNLVDVNQLMTDNFNIIKNERVYYSLIEPKPSPRPTAAATDDRDKIVSGVFHKLCNLYNPLWENRISSLLHNGIFHKLWHDL